MTAFVDAGADEVLAGMRKREDHEALKAERVTPVQLDVTSDEDVAKRSRRWVPIDILINNAGVAGFGNPLTMNFAAIQEEIAVNYLGVLRVTRAVAPGMIAKRDGVIVNVATAFAKSESAADRHVLRDQGGVVVVGPGIACVSCG